MVKVLLAMGRAEEAAKLVAALPQCEDFEPDLLAVRASVITAVALKGSYNFHLCCKASL